MSLARGGRVRGFVSALLKDWWRYDRAIRAHDDSYLALCNRSERLERAPDSEGFRCDWRWTSDLHAPKHLPGLGLRLMKKALDDHPIVRAQSVDSDGGSPEVTFIIGHRGMDRLPHLLATLESIAGQQGALVECVVVEQDVEARLAHHLPSWVRHVHAPPPSPDMPYCRAWAFNIGARHAKADVLVLHDNDMLATANYAAEVLRRMRKGFDIANLKRFVFYLSEGHTAGVFSNQEELLGAAPLAVVQNLEAGGSIAITREAYERIGGMDESFVGWGGEDNEFWERAQTLRVSPFARLPMVHLWHAAQPGKSRADNPTVQRLSQLSAVPVDQRISRLVAGASGELAGPNGWTQQDNRTCQAVRT